ncbi:MAG: hypothetical protein R3Y29_01335 [bacterium]
MDFYNRFRLEGFKVKDILFFNMLNDKEKEYVLKKYPSILNTFNYVPIKKNLKLFFLDGDQFGINQILSLTWTLRYLNYLSSKDFYALKIIKLDNDDTHSKVLSFESDILTYIPVKFELGHNIDNKVDNMIAMDLINTINNLTLIEQPTNIYIVSNDKAILDFQNSYSVLNRFNLYQQTSSNDDSYDSYDSYDDDSYDDSYDDSDDGDANNYNINNLINIIGIKKDSLFTNYTSASEVNLTDLPIRLLLKIISKDLIQDYPNEVIKNYSNFRAMINNTLNNALYYKSSIEKYDSKDLDANLNNKDNLDNLDNKDNQKSTTSTKLDDDNTNNTNNTNNTDNPDNPELTNQDTIVLENKLNDEVKECLKLCEIPLNEYNLNMAINKANWLNKVYTNYKENLKSATQKNTQKSLTSSLKHSILKHANLKAT